MPLLFIFFISYLFIFKPSHDFKNLKDKKEFNFVLITLDTIRADRIGCYGFSNIKTPVIDSFARKGVMFKKCISSTPLTLPSHTSILSGTSPLYHGVRDNGGFLVPNELTTLAEVFKNNGYQTAAFVASYVLDSRWGLYQGFDYYFDQFDLGLYKSVTMADIQRPANEVIDQVLGWFKEKNPTKYFVWVHLYDPHTPYDPPSPYKEKYPNNPYLGEIAFADNQIGRLVDYLKENHMDENTIIIFAGDHGESLGQHKEQTHGFFIYQEGIHVPLIFVFPFKKLQGISREIVTSLEDIAPTVLEMAGLEIPRDVQGKSLIPFFFKEDRRKNRFAYSETYYARFHYGWSELKSIQNKKYKLIISSDPELYDLQNDPEETNNLARENQTLLKSFLKEADQLISDFSQNALSLDYSKLDEEARRKLSALGYIGTYTNPAKLKGKKLANPKNKVDIFNRLGMAKEMGFQGKFKEAVDIVENIIFEEPEIINAYTILGYLYFNQHKYEKAISYFTQVLERNPDDTTSIINIANSYLRMNKLAEAEKIMIDFLKIAQPDSIIYFLLGKINWVNKKYDDALKYYHECLKVNPNSSSAHKELATIYFLQRQIAKAEEHIQQCLNLNPKLTDAHYTLAQIMEKKGAKEAAIEAYLKELQISPRHLKACYNLSVLYRELGLISEEKKYLEKAIEINPNFPLSYIYLARIYLKRQENYEEAIKLVNKALELKPEKKYEAGCYFLLADLYNILDNNNLAQKYAQKGKEIQNSNLKKNEYK